MNVFVETNYVLEVALEQEDVGSCEAILSLAENRLIRLLIPAYCFIEPHETLKRRHLDREALRSRVSSELGQLARSAWLRERVEESRKIDNLLADSMQDELVHIEQVRQRLWTIAEVLPIDINVLRMAAEWQKVFAPQDAIIYAAIRSQLGRDHAAASCLVSRNPADFDNEDVRRDLASLNCKYLSSFRTALDYINHVVGSQ